MLLTRYQLKTRNAEEFIVEGSVGADKRRAQHLRSMDALRRRIDEHLSVLLIIFPHLHQVSLDRSQAPTAQNLYLPSSFSEDQIKEYGMSKLAEQEGQLRVGNAHDHLSSLRDALGLRSLLLQAKEENIRGQVKTTRAEATISRASAVVQRHEAGYRRNYAPFKKLKVGTGPGDSGEGLQELKEGDLKSLRSFIDNNTYTGNPAELPWIWRISGGVIGERSGTGDVRKAVESWEQEGERGYKWRQ